MRKSRCIFVHLASFLATFLLCLTADAGANSSENGEMNRYMLIGTATPEVYATVIKNPQDRSAGARILMEKAGCRLVDYYFGINNYTMYIIVDCPDEDTLAALQFVLFASGGMIEAKSVRIVDGQEAVSIMQAGQKLTGAYAIPE